MSSAEPLETSLAEMVVNTRRNREIWQDGRAQMQDDKSKRLPINDMAQYGKYARFVRNFGVFSDQLGPVMQA
jgi:hypothetical protein